MGHHTHLTLEEREMIMAFYHEGRSICEIARLIGRNKSTISRELKRNHLWARVYIAVRAQQMYVNRRIECRPHMRLENPELFQIVRKQFLEHKWSPEQIANRIAMERPDLRISTNTIYRAIYRHLLDYNKYVYGKGLAKKLRHKGKRRLRHGEEHLQGKIIISNNLCDRPEAADKRLRLGDWEADTIVGKQGGLCVVSLVDRKSRYLLLGTPVEKQAEPVCKSMISILKGHSLETVTPDRGKEFAFHEMVTKRLGVPFFFPLPRHPWDRGTNENTNGLVREYMPKGCDINQFTDSEILWIQNELNTRPRKCLGFRTPYEVYYSETLHLV